MAGAPSAQAISLTAWDFAGRAGDELTVTATFVQAGFVSTTITRGGTQDPVPQPDTFWNNSWPFDPHVDGYFEFRVVPAPGTTFSLTDIQLNLATDPGGPNSWALYSDADGFASALGGSWNAFPGPGLTFSTHTTVLPATADFQNLTGARVFRLYGFNSTGAGGGLGGAGPDVSINGIMADVPVETVPETLPIGVFGATAAALLWFRRRCGAPTDR